MIRTPVIKRGITMREADIQNQIRIHVASQPLGVMFRANVGEAWTGERVERNPDGSITIYNPRRFKAGLPPGFSDLFGVATGGRAVFIEVKSATGRLLDDQRHFLNTMAKVGALAGVARNTDDAESIFDGQNIGL